LVDDIINQQTMTEDQINELLKEYLSTLSEKEYKAYKIAESHLGTSFDLIKSNGYLKWLSKKKEE
jgi:uncharacterized protein YpmS